MFKLFNNNDGRRPQRNIISASTSSSFYFNNPHHRPSIQWLLATFSCGIVLGLLLQKLQVYESNQMQQQFLFEDVTLIKALLAAIISGMFVCSILSMLPHTNQMLRATMNWYPLQFENRSYTSCALGGSFLGIGMALSGACPTTLFVQLGSGVPKAVWVFIGGYCSTIIFDFCRPIIGKFIFRRKCLLPFYFHRWMVSPYFNMALPIAVILATATFSLELYKPSSRLSNQASGSDLQLVLWSPYIIGILISLLHLSLIGIFHRFISNSDSLISINEFILCLLKNRRLPASLFSLVFNFGIISGAYFSSLFSNHTESLQASSSWYQSFIGGFIMFFGAKLSSGCSIGHCVSGVMSLSKLSLFSVPFLFLSGYVTASFLSA